MDNAASGDTAPVVVLSSGYAGAQLVQQALSSGTELACTMGTGILPLCEAATATWARVDGRRGEPASRLALSSIRSLITVQLTVLLSAAGKPRWCELATSPPSAAQAFLQVFPATRFVCVHRACTDVISAAIRAQPWGLTAPQIMPFTVSYPGNSVAAVAAYWAWATEQLLRFEEANPRIVSRVRYEDVAADAGGALAGVRASLRLPPAAHQLSLPDVPGLAEEAGPGQPAVPADMIPVEVRERLGQLHSALGYPRTQLAGAALTRESAAG